MDRLRFGIEAEYALLRPDGRFADYTNTEYEEVRALVEPLPDYGHAELRTGDAGIRVKNWYVEGDERFDESGHSTGMAVKGLEIRTPVFATIEDCLRSLDNLRRTLMASLEAHDWSLVVTGFNPCTRSYRPTYTSWEKEFHASHVENALPEVSTLSFGPDFNFSSSGFSAQSVLDTVRRLTYYSPFIVPFSFNSPLVGGSLWEGLSYRTYMRTGPRPAALAHLLGFSDHPLVKKAEPPSQHLRIEFKAFDMVDDDLLLAELFYLVIGISLADAAALPGRADVPDQKMHRHVAVSGLSDELIHRKSYRVVTVAKQTLREFGFSGDLPLLESMLATRRTPAHAVREHILQEQAGCGQCISKVWPLLAAYGKRALPAN